MIDPANLTPEERAGVAHYQLLEANYALSITLSLAQYELERVANEMESEAKRIRELLTSRLATPQLSVALK